MNTEEAMVNKSRAQWYTHMVPLMTLKTLKRNYRDLVHIERSYVLEGESTSEIEDVRRAKDIAYRAILKKEQEQGV